MTKRPPQFKIVETIRMLEMLTGNIQYLKELTDDTKKHLESACSEYLQESDKDQRKELVRFLYWHSNLSPTQIQNLTGRNSKQLSATAGPLCFKSDGSQAVCLITAPFGARLPSSTANPPSFDNGVSLRQITSVS